MGDGELKSQAGEGAVSVPETEMGGLGEDGALSLLQKPDLLPVEIERISKSPIAMKSRNVRIAVAAHGKAPRHISVPLIRQLFTFDLLKLSLMPAVAADIRRAADEALIKRLESLTLGERLSLARRGSGALAAALLLDRQSRVMEVALENDRLTESLVIRAITHPATPAQLIAAICRHPKWCHREEVRIGLLRSCHTPRTQAIEFARGISTAKLEEILSGSRLPKETWEFLWQDMRERMSREKDSEA